MLSNNIYLASGIFNADSNLYNGYLAKYLENKGYNCYLPQRDGFLVANLNAYLHKHNPDIANQAANYIPYYFDLGWCMSRSIAVVANMDDPIDIGMTVEVCYAHFAKLPVIGVRTDISAPFGNAEDIISINPFPVAQCDVYLKTKPFLGDYAQVTSQLDATFEVVAANIARLIKLKTNHMHQSDNPAIQNILQAATILFADVADVHSEQGIIEVVNKYIENKAFFAEISPELI